MAEGSGQGPDIEKTKGAYNFREIVGSMKKRDEEVGKSPDKIDPDKMDPDEFAKRLSEADRFKQGLTGEPMSGAFKSREGLLEKPQAPKAPPAPKGPAK